MSTLRGSLQAHALALRLTGRRNGELYKKTHIHGENTDAETSTEKYVNTIKETFGTKVKQEIGY